VPVWATILDWSKRTFLFHGCIAIEVAAYRRRIVSTQGNEHVWQRNYSGDMVFRTEGYHYTCHDGILLFSTLASRRAWESLRRYSPEAILIPIWLFADWISSFFHYMCSGNCPDGTRVYPKSSHTQFFDCVLGEPEVAKGKERIKWAPSSQVGRGLQPIAKR
jgi:hypothetical protein